MRFFFRHRGCIFSRISVHFSLEAVMYGNLSFESGLRVLLVMERV